MSHPELTGVIEKLEELSTGREKKKHGYLRKPKLPDFELNEFDLSKAILTNEAFKSVNHATQRERKREIPHKKVPMERKIKESEKSQGEKIFIDVTARLYEELKNIFPMKKERKSILPPFSDEELLFKIKQREGKVTNLDPEVLEFFLQRHLSGDDENKTNITIDNQGNILTDKPSLTLLSKALSKEEKKLSQGLLHLTSIFGKENLEDITIASVISFLSGEDNIVNTSWLSTDGKEKYFFKNIRNLLSSFPSTLKDMFFWKAENNFINLLNTALNNEQVDLTKINQYICSILFQNFYGGNNNASEKNLGEFTNLPGVPEVVLALRKIYIASLTKKTMSHTKTPDENFLISPSNDVWNKAKPLSDVYKSSSNNSINPANFIGLSTQDIIKQLVFFIVEKKIKNNKKSFSERKIRSGKESYEFIGLPFLKPDQIHVLIDNSGLRIPINVSFSRRSKDIGLLNIFYNESDISMITIPIETQE